MAFAGQLRARYGSRAQICPQDEFGLLDLQSLLSEPIPGTLVYCCGPEPLLAAVAACSRTWPAGALRLERFGGPPTGTGAVVDTPFEVELAISGRTLAVPVEQSILETVEKAGIAVLSSCRGGTCGTCETGVLAGVPDHRDLLLTEDERCAHDVMMICVSRALTPRLVLDL